MNGKNDLDTNNSNNRLYHENNYDAVSILFESIHNNPYLLSFGRYAESILMCKTMIIEIVWNLPINHELISLYFTTRPIFFSLFLGSK